jgi:hypothetical protein
VKPFSALLAVICASIITLPAPSLSDELSPDSIIGITKRVANFHMKSGPICPNTNEFLQWRANK